LDPAPTIRPESARPHDPRQATAAAALTPGWLVQPVVINASIALASLGMAPVSTS
jgi:hypothetical protein